MYQWDPARHKAKLGHLEDPKVNSCKSLWIVTYHAVLITHDFPELGSCKQQILLLAGG